MRHDRLPAHALPLLFFGFAHLCLVAAGLAMLLTPGSLVGFYYHPRLVAVVHLVTLGWITSSVLGALQILTPSVLRSPLPVRRVDFAVFLGYATGVVGMVAHFWLDRPHGMAWAAATVVGALGVYATRTLPAIVRGRVPAAVRAHLLLAMGNLLAAGIAGTLLGLHELRPFLPVSSFAGALGHAHLAALGFGVMIVAGAGYRLIPMFLPAAMPRGRSLWASAALLQAGAWGLFATLAAGPRLEHWPTAIAATTSALGLIAVFTQVAAMLRNRRRAPPTLRRPDWGMVQVGSAFVWALVAAVLGLGLAWTDPGAWKIPAAEVYAVAGLLGFLGQMVAGIGHRLVPIYLWLRSVAAAGLPRSPFSPIALPSRDGQALGIALWTLAVPLLGTGLASGWRVAVSVGGVCLAGGGGAGAWTLGRAATRAARMAREESDRATVPAAPARKRGTLWRMTDRVREALDTAPFFGALPAAVRAALVPTASCRPMTRKERIFDQGDPATRLFLVLRGKVRLVQAGDDGSEVVVRFFGPGEIFGGIALVEAADYPVTAEAVETGELLFWQRPQLLEVATDHPELALATTRAIAQRMRELQERFREVATRRVDHRLARALQRLAAQVGRLTPSGLVLDLPLSRLDLAEMTGTTLFTVSRLLSAWQQQGIVRIGRERVKILDAERLAQLGE